MSPIKKLLGMLMVVSLAAVSGIAYSESKSVDTLKERIAPVGETCMSGDSCAAAPVSAGQRSGKDIFGAVCTNCHSSGVLGAPKFGNIADWAPRAAKGLETLYTHTIVGFNSMPPKGACAVCTDDEIKGAVKYMVESSK